MNKTEKKLMSKSNAIVLIVVITILVLVVMLVSKGGNDSKIISNGGEEKLKMTKATIETNKGTFVFELYTEKAPITTANFIKLAKSGFYDGLKFHRYEPGFVIQGGDPKGDGTGGSDENIKLEIHPDLRHKKGAIAMARSMELDSASSQFYVTLADSHFLDDNYAVFGMVTEGMEVALELRAGDKMTKVTIDE